MAEQTPSRISKDIQSVQRLYQSVNNSCKNLFGLSDSCAIPVRSTLLHFHYPDVIPIFDKQVLLAVGIDEKGANKSYDILFNYIPFAWEIADDSSFVPQNWQETPLRLLDMALWVVRGNSKYYKA